MLLTTSSSRKYNAGFDIMKLIMALAIMFAHICSENVSVHPILKSLTSVYNFGVPFFFACSGFLFFLKYKGEDKNNHWETYIKFTKRILLMYAVWSAIYFCFVFVNWIQDGATIEVILKYFHKALVFTTYGTIWFLPSLWIGISIVFFLFHFKLNLNQVAVVAFFAYLIGSLGYSYFSLIDDSALGRLLELYDTIFITTRNGIFAGFPFVMIGAYLALNGIKTRRLTSLTLMVLFCSLFICEAVFIKYKMHANVDMGFMLVPAVFFMMSWLAELELNPKPIYLRFRNQSMLIFLGQRLFITAIPSVLPAVYIKTLTQNPYVGLLLFVSQVVLFSIFLEWASKRYPSLKVLW